jgi:hypothetical protein
MALKRTQVYFEPEQHRLLKREAEAEGVSLAELLRRLATEYLRNDPTREDFARIVGLGKSGYATTAEKHDRAIAGAISEDETLR